MLRRTPVPPLVFLVKDLALVDVIKNLDVSVNDQSIPAAPSPPPPPPPHPWATAGHLPALSVPGVGHLQILHCPGAEYLPTPSSAEYNYTADFTGKTSRLAHLSRKGKN